MDCCMPGFPVLHPFPELAQTHVHWVSDAIQPSHPLSSPSPPAFSILSIVVFSSESDLRIGWPVYWSFSFNISPSNECSELISFRIDWVWSLCNPRDSQESSPTPQFKSINSSVFSLLYSPTLTSMHDHWKTIALTFVSKVRSLPFNMLYRFVTAFLPRSKCLIISWLPSLSTWFWSPGKIKSFTVSTFYSSICQSLQMVTAAMKLKDACSLEGKLWPT